MAAIGFKAVHGGRVSGVQRVTPDVLAAMEEMSLVAPAHNPPYIKAMRLLGREAAGDSAGGGVRDGLSRDDRRSAAVLSGAVRVGEKLHIKRWGFHGASHRYIAQRTSQLLGRYDLRIISCHLGGSNSLCAIRGQQSVATSMGMSPQTGLPHNNRVGDFDPFAIPLIMQAEGLSLHQVLDILAEKVGAAGSVAESAATFAIWKKRRRKGNARAKLALDVFVARDSPAFGRTAGRAGRRRCDRVHRRHRRERRRHSRGRLCGTGRAGNRARSGAECQGEGRVPQSAAKAAACRCGWCRRTKN